MSEPTLQQLLYQAVAKRDVEAASDALSRFQCPQADLDACLRFAARRNDLALVKLLVKAGANIHATDGLGDPPAPEGVIAVAASNGAVEVVRWLLDHGARVNYVVDGVMRCQALSGAAIDGHLEVVKLLVEHGADVNAAWAGQNALSFAIMYGHKEIEAYLRMKNATQPPHGVVSKLLSHSEAVREHFERTIGKIDTLALQEIVPSEPRVAINVIRTEDKLVLFTTGVSDRPMTVPDGFENYRFAELVIYLPTSWPITDAALKDPKNSWPIDWLRRIARYPHERRTWLGGHSAVFANDEPPKPFAPNTQLTCLLALTEASEFVWIRCSDDTVVAIYSLYPIYTEERDLERTRGTEALVQRFQKHGISTVVDIHRQNVAKTP